MSDIWAQQVLPDILGLFTDKYCEVAVRSDDPSKQVSLIFPHLYAIFKLDDNKARSQSHIDIIMKWLHFHKNRALQQAESQIKSFELIYTKYMFSIHSTSEKIKYINNVGLDFKRMLERCINVPYTDFKMQITWNIEPNCIWAIIDLFDLTGFRLCQIQSPINRDTIINILAWIYSIQHRSFGTTTVDGTEEYIYITIC